MALTSSTPAPRAEPSAQELAGQWGIRGPSRSFWQDARARFLRDRLGIAGALIFALLCLIALGAPLVSQYVTGYDPDRVNLRENYQPPGPAHWFGTDEYGRDYFTRIVFAGRVSLSIGVLVAAISLTIGVVFGLAGAYYGGWIDDAVQGLINVLNAIPFLPLLIIIGSFMRFDPTTLAVTLALLGWTGASRQIRGLVLSVKRRDYVTAATTVGASDWRIMLQHILPNVFSIVLVLVGFDIVGAILQESALSFLGFGVAPPTATWGNMLSNSLQYNKYPWLVFYPGLAISLTVLSVFLLADGLRDAMDPRLRA